MMAKGKLTRRMKIKVLKVLKPIVCAENYSHGDIKVLSKNFLQFQKRALMKLYFDQLKKSLETFWSIIRTTMVK